MTIIAIAPTCDARIGTRFGPWGTERPVWCSASRGLTAYQDDHGVTRHFCRHHRVFVEHRFRPAPAPEACRFCGDTAAIVDGRYVLVSFEDGLRVVCDGCYSKADEADEDEPEWSNAEGDPTRNGAFA